MTSGCSICVEITTVDNTSPWIQTPIKTFGLLPSMSPRGKTHFTIAGKLFLQMRENFLALRENFLPLRETFLPLRENFLPLREHFLSLQENFLKMREYCLPLQKTFLPLRETFYHWGKTFFLRENFFLLQENSIIWFFFRMDYPAAIDYILNITSHSKLQYVGYSMGSTQYPILLSEVPEYNEKISAGHLLGPPIFFQVRPTSNRKNIGKTFYHCEKLITIQRKLS